MATVSADMIRGDANESGNGLVSILLARTRLIFGKKIKQRATLVERVSPPEIDFYDRFYG